MSEPRANHVKPRANAKIKLAISLFSRKRKHLTTHLKSVPQYIYQKNGAVTRINEVLEFFLTEWVIK